MFEGKYDFSLLRIPRVLENLKAILLQWGVHLRCFSVVKPKVSTNSSFSPSIKSPRSSTAADPGLLKIVYLVYFFTFSASLLDWSQTLIRSSSALMLVVSSVGVMPNFSKV